MQFLMYKFFVDKVKYNDSRLIMYYSYRILIAENQVWNKLQLNFILKKTMYIDVMLRTSAVKGNKLLYLRLFNPCVHNLVTERKSPGWELNPLTSPTGRRHCNHYAIMPYHFGGFAQLHLSFGQVPHDIEQMSLLLHVSMLCTFVPMKGKVSWCI